MNPCGSCGYSSRQGATIVSFISTGHFLLQLIMICVFGQENSGIGIDGKPLVRGASTDEYYGLIVSQVVLIAVSILLFVGARYCSICMILPWIIMTSLADIGYFFVLVGSLILVFSNYHVLYVTALLGSIFLFVIISYLLWIVIYFLLDLLSERNSYQMFGSNVDNPSRETPVKKYLLRQDKN